MVDLLREGSRTLLDAAMRMLASTRLVFETNRWGTAGEERHSGASMRTPRGEQTRRIGNARKSKGDLLRAG
jgi:hypothetical protein